MITFTRAPTVAKGEAVTSTQLAKLAKAFNDRLRSGLGDPTWRIIFYWLSLFRQVRNSDESGLLFPALAEYFTSGYQMLEPSQGSWPLTGPGEPEGAHVASQMMAYVFGAEALNLPSEDLRLTDPDAGGGIPLGLGNSPPVTDGDYWALAKLQRGGFDPETGAIGSPAWQAARSHHTIRMSNRSPHGNAYGGYLPTPDLAPDPCDDPVPDPAPRNYLIRFKSLKAGLPDKVYPGTCQPVPGGNSYSGHVAAISYSQEAYYVWLNNGTLEVLAVEDYVEGPYTGEAALRKTANGALGRALNSYIREYRGSDFQRDPPEEIHAEAIGTETGRALGGEDSNALITTSDPALGYWLEEAFDFQRFFTTQYHLAPNRGVEAGGYVNIQYPLFRLTGATLLSAGTLATHIQSGGAQHHYHKSCVLTGCLVTAVKMAGSATIELLNGTTVIQSVAVSAGSDGLVEKLVLFSSPIRPAPLKVRLASAAHFQDATGKIEVECTEIRARKPDYEDAFLLIRAASATPGEGMDDRGIDDDNARLIGQTYFDRGAIVNIHGTAGLPGQANNVNSNGVYDAARRLSQCVRIMPRQQFIGYAVENGKSVLWFTRRAQIHADVDMFAGIGPGQEEIADGFLKPERNYVVRSGSITYGGVTYTAGQVFTAVKGARTWIGSGAVFEFNGIRHTAEPEALTNEWLLGIQLKPYHPSDSSLWKPDAYSDYWPLVNRCHFYSPEIANDPPLKWHTSYGQSVSGTYGGVLAPESPSGWNYAPLSVAWLGRGHVNKMICDEEDEECRESRRNFYRSCRLYEPDVEIDSATVSIEAGEEVIKLVLKGRLHHAKNAPPVILRDTGTWELEALVAEAGTIRTVENALREYLVNQSAGINATRTGRGNNGANSTVQSLPDNPYGSVYPTFLFTQLIPSPREDSNDDQDPTDTPVHHDPFTRMELYLRAMCEGYVDGKTTGDQRCAHNTTSLFDFTFQNLCLQAFGNRWFTLLPTTLRPDNAEGFGPLPNTELYSAIYNQFSAAVNLLTRVRVMLPMTLEVWKESADAVQYATVLDADGTENSSCTTGVAKVFWDGTPPDAAPSFVSSNWSVLETPSASVSAKIDDTCEGSGWPIKTTRQSSKIRWQTTDSDAIEAIPENWRDMLEDAPALFAAVTRKTVKTGKKLVDIADSACCPCNPPTLGFWFNDPQYWAWVYDTVEESTCDIMPKVIDVPALEANTLARGKAADGTPCDHVPVNEASVDPIIDNAAMIDVPLV